MKGKDASIEVTCERRQPETSPQQIMVIVSKYELEEKSPGLFMFGVQNWFPVLCVMVALKSLVLVHVEVNGWMVVTEPL